MITPIIPIGMSYGRNNQHVVLEEGNQHKYPYLNRFLVECRLCSEEMGITAVKVLSRREVENHIVFCKKHAYSQKSSKTRVLAPSKDEGRHYVYVYKITGDKGSFTGFGITRHIVTRTKTHERNLKAGGYIVEDITIFETTKFSAWRTEKALKGIFEITPTRIEGFVKEATHYELYNQVVNTAKMFLQGDGNFKLHVPVQVDNSGLATSAVDLRQHATSNKISSQGISSFHDGNNLPVYHTSQGGNISAVAICAVRMHRQCLQRVNLRSHTFRTRASSKYRNSYSVAEINCPTKSVGKSLASASERGQYTFMEAKQISQNAPRKTLQKP